MMRNVRVITSMAVVAVLSGCGSVAPSSEPSPYGVPALHEMCSEQPESPWCDCVLRRETTEDCE